MLVHPIEPIYDENSKVLILGSFPSVKSREQGFYYGHPQNRFWKVLAGVFGEQVPQTIDEKREFLLTHQIALWDTIASCEIEGSSDASISNVVANDLSRILNTAQIRAIYCNGDTSYSLFQKYIANEQGNKLPVAVRLPSTSPANAAWSLEALIGAFSRIKTAMGREDMSTPYYALSDFAMDAYGMKLYRLSLDGGFTCPNRDGTLGTKGCIFCDAGGAGDFGGGGERANSDGNRHLSYSIERQLSQQKQMVASKLPKTKKVGYIAYFQSFTGTYAAVDYLRSKYEEAIKDPEVRVLSIATRPDCLGPEVLELLRELNTRIPVWIELGLQTKHKKSIEYIRRGYDNKVYEQAVKKLLAIGIHQIITHVILGLPNETEKMMLDTVSYVAKTGATGIKLQLLHVLDNTDLATDYEAKKFQTLEFEEYISITRKCVDLLPPDFVVHRLTGDGNKNHLIAPLWSADKKRVINEMKRILS